MNIYIDESGSINNHIPNNKYFIIAMIRATNKDSLKRAYKRFVSSHHDRLLELDKEMKQSFVDYFSRKHTFEVYFIKIANEKLTDHFCQNPARVFNYTMKLAIEYLINKGYLPNEDCSFQLDERNEKIGRCWYSKICF